MARFIRLYGAGAFLGPWPQTRDGFIPWRLFWLLLSQSPHVMAWDRLNLARAVAHGAGQVAFGTKEMIRVMESELRDAFPEGI